MVRIVVIVVVGLVIGSVSFVSCSEKKDGKKQQEINRIDKVMQDR